MTWFCRLSANFCTVQEKVTKQLRFVRLSKIAVKKTTDPSFPLLLVSSYSCFLTGNISSGPKIALQFEAKNFKNTQSVHLKSSSVT